MQASDPLDPRARARRRRGAAWQRRSPPQAKRNGRPRPPLRATQGDPANVCDEHTELKWFSISEMLPLTNMVDSDYPLFAQLAMTGKAT
jgi:hypothetical protein